MLVVGQTKMYVLKSDGTVDSVSLSQVKGISFRAGVQVSMTGTWDMIATKNGWTPWNADIQITDNNGTLSGTMTLPAAALGSVAAGGTISIEGVATAGGDVSFFGEDKYQYRNEVKSFINPTKTKMLGTFFVNGTTFNITVTKR